MYQVTASSFRERDTLISQAANLVVRGMFYGFYGDIEDKNFKKFKDSKQDFNPLLLVMTISINQAHVDDEGSLKEPSTIID